MVSSSTESCLGVILAGGLSSRMGQDKATLMRGNVDMLSFTKQRLIEAGMHRVAVSGDQYDVADRYPQMGPVGGILSVIEQYQPSSMLIMPIDLPLITASAIQHLKTLGALTHQACCYQQHQLPLYLPVNGYLELALLRLRKTMLAANQGKGPSIKQLLNDLPHQSIVCPQPSLLFNSNTPQQWQQVQQQWLTTSS